jgi:hypothetical protein
VSRTPEQALLAALPWGRSAQGNVSRLYVFPSWIWADWRGTVVSFKHSEHAFTIHEPTRRNVEFEGESGEISEPTFTSDSASSKSDFQKALDTVVAMHFDALILPATLFQRKEPKCAGGMDISAPNYSFAGHRHGHHPPLCSTTWRSLLSILTVVCSRSSCWATLGRPDGIRGLS